MLPAYGRTNVLQARGKC